MTENINVSADQFSVSSSLLSNDFYGSVEGETPTDCDRIEEAEETVFEISGHTLFASLDMQLSDSCIEELKTQALADSKTYVNYNKSEVSSMYIACENSLEGLFF